MAVAVELTIVAAFTLPVLAMENTRDWIAYAQAAQRLAAAEPLYPFDGTTIFYLYPPPAAWLWSLGMSPALLLVVKAAALLGVAVLAVRLGFRPAVLGAAAAVSLTLLVPSVQHDLVLANVMALYMGAIALSLASTGWRGSAALGVVLAVALKPFIGPYLVWMALRRPRQALRVGAVAGLATALFAWLIGPARYLEYAEALPSMSVLATGFTGNVGLVTISPALAAAGVVLAYLAVLVTGRRLDQERGAVVALAASLLAQPTLGFAYASILVPAALLLWSKDRLVGLLAALIAPITALVLPAIAALTVGALALRRAVWPAMPEQ